MILVKNPNLSPIGRRFGFNFMYYTITAMQAITTEIYEKSPIFSLNIREAASPAIMPMAEVIGEYVDISILATIYTPAIAKILEHNVLPTMEINLFGLSSEIELRNSALFFRQAKRKIRKVAMKSIALVKKKNEFSSVAFSDIVKDFRTAVLAQLETVTANNAKTKPMLRVLAGPVFFSIATFAFL